MTATSSDSGTGFRRIVPMQRGAHDVDTTPVQRPRLVGVDATRGVALLGLYRKPRLGTPHHPVLQAIERQVPAQYFAGQRLYVIGAIHLFVSGCQHRTGRIGFEFGDHRSDRGQQAHAVAGSCVLPG